jgi:ATP-dependent DNA helicase RecQ
MANKPVAEQEIGHALLQEMVAYAETSMSRRKFILHYFGEDFDNETGEGGDMDDNIRHPKKKVEATKDAQVVLETVEDTLEKYKSKDLVQVITGQSNALISSHKTDTQDFLDGVRKRRRGTGWALIRQLLVAGLLRKDIESYGVLKLTEAGRGFISSPETFMMTEDHVYDEQSDDGIITNTKGGGAADENLMKMLKDLRKRNAKRLGVPPFVIFQDPSLEDMALKYPISLEELSNVHGVGESKARKYGKDFVNLIADYVEENDITRPDELVVKSTGTNSALKLYIIQNVDRKLPLTDIANAKGMDMPDL